jgi:hypothetical protein
VDETSIDLRDHRGRLVRLITAVAIGITAAVLVMAAILSIAATPDDDPVSGASVGVFAIALAVFATLLAHWTIGLVARMRRR